jgi:septin family protein
MFLTNIYTSQPTSLTDRLGQTLQVETHRISLEEQGVRLALTLVDTPGTHRISLEEQGVRLALTLVDTPGTHTGLALWSRE